MAKFNKPGVRAQGRGPIQTLGQSGVTYEGDYGFARDPKSELFMLAVVNMVGEDTFYETASDRDSRYRNLIHTVTAQDNKWMQSFLPWLRGPDANMRTASVVGALEYAVAGGPNARQVISASLQRADEPGEALAYWHQRFGKFPSGGVQRGIADAVSKLYTQRALLKYDGKAGTFRFADVIELVRPTPKDEEQRLLFRYAIERRHNRDFFVAPNSLSTDGALPMILADRALMELSSDRRREVLKDSGLLRQAGWTWERLSGWIPGGMDAAAWEAVIPQMGYMALLRNLRNFDQADISPAMRDRVVAKLVDPAEVASSRQFPFRFWSAYKNTPSERWNNALSRALDLSVSNIPKLPGKTLVLCDTSGSMWCALSNKSSVPRQEVGVLFGVIQFLRAQNADLVLFDTDSQAVRLHPTTSVLRGVSDALNGRRQGGATYTWSAIQKHYANHDRVVIFTDMQSQYHDDRMRVAQIQIPRLYNFNLAGYSRTNMEVGQDGVYEMGGFSDATFRMIPLLERARNAQWPWEDQ